MKSREFAKSFRIADGSHFRLKDFSPSETLGLKSKDHAQETLQRGVHRSLNFRKNYTPRIAGPFC
jgi:hypothetical protein